MRAQTDFDVVPTPKENVWVMVLLLRDVSNMVDEFYCVRKVSKFVVLLYSFRDEFPIFDGVKMLLNIILVHTLINLQKRSVYEKIGSPALNHLR